MSIVVDCGNGVPGAFAPELYRRLGCTVRELFCEVDGSFPNHHPDPSQPENLQDLIAALAHGDEELGLAFDGDGDRLGRGHQSRQDHLSGPPAHAVRRRCADAQPGRGSHLRREVARATCSPGSQPRRRAAAVEDRAFADQGQDEGDRRAAGRRNERPHLLQGALVRLRRRHVRRRAPARVSERACATSMPSSPGCPIRSTRPSCRSSWRKARTTR